MSALLGALISEFADRSREDRQAQLRKDLVNRAAALLGFNGANPSEDELSRKTSGDVWARPDLQELPDAQKDAEFQHLKALRESEVANQPVVNAWKTGQAMKDAGYGGDDFQKQMLLQRLPAILDKLSTRQQADVIGGKALGDPFTLNGGVMGNTETGKISDVSPAVNALATLRQQQAVTEGHQQGQFDANAAAAKALEGLRSQQSQTEVNRRGLFDANAAAALAAEALRKSQADEQLKKTQAADAYLQSHDMGNLTRSTGKLSPLAGRVFKAAKDGKVGYYQMNDQGKAVPIQDTTETDLEIPGPVGRGPGGDQVKSEYYQKELGISPEESIDLINTPVTDGLGGNPRAAKIAEFVKRKTSTSPVTQRLPAGWTAEQAYGAAAKALRGNSDGKPKNPQAVKKMLQDMGLDPSKVGL